MARPELERRIAPQGDSESDESKLSVHPEYSDERERWSVFKQFLAITFSSKRRRSWWPDELAPERRSEIVRAIEARRSIAAAYGDLHAGMRRLVQSAREIEGFPRLPPVWQPRDPELRKLASHVAAAADLPTRDQDALVAIVSRAEAVAQRINLLAPGIIDAREGRSGSIAMKFQLWRQSGNWKAAEVEAEAQAITAFAAEALEILQMACAKLKAGADLRTARSC